MRLRLQQARQRLERWQVRWAWAISLPAAFQSSRRLHRHAIRPRPQVTNDATIAPGSRKQRRRTRRRKSRSAPPRPSHTQPSWRISLQNQSFQQGQRSVVRPRRSPWLALAPRALADTHAAQKKASSLSNLLEDIKTEAASKTESKADERAVVGPRTVQNTAHRCVEGCGVG